MPPHGRLLKARSQYRDIDLASRVNAADAHGLIAILYDELIHALDVMHATLRQGRPLPHDPAAIRAQTILNTLLASLDPDQGGNAAHLFASVYRGMIARLKRGMQEGNAHDLSEVRVGVSELQRSWASLKNNFQESPR